MSNSSNKLVLIDGNAILHRAYHAFPQSLQTQKGELTNATYGFTSTLLTVVKRLKPSHMIVTFDRKEPTFRHKQFKAYKASRPKMDEELVGQIQRTKQVVDVLNLPQFELAGFEADDLIGSIAMQAKELKSKTIAFQEIIIVTGDKDELQLIDNKVNVYFPSRGRIPEQLFNFDEFVNKYGFKPRQLIDFKALAGDQSDEIPGVNGIGPKTATDLIIKFKSLEKIYMHLDQINPTVREKLEKDKDQAFLSKDLATIKTDVSIEFNPDKSLLKDYDKQKAISLFEELEFKSLIKRLPNDSWEEMTQDIFDVQEKPVKTEEDKKNQMTLF
jgi:DNA polymerase I